MSLQLRSLQEVLEKTVFLPSLYLIALEPLPTNDTKNCDTSKDILGHLKINLQITLKSLIISSSKKKKPWQMCLAELQKSIQTFASGYEYELIFQGGSPKDCLKRNIFSKVRTHLRYLFSFQKYFASLHRVSL